MMKRSDDGEGELRVFESQGSNTKEEDVRRRLSDVFPAAEAPDEGTRKTTKDGEKHRQSIYQRENAEKDSR